MVDKTETINLSLESIAEKDGRLVITTKSLTKDFESERVLKMLAKSSIGKHYVWRHRHPLNPEHSENHIYGEFKNSWVEDDFYSEIELYDHTNDHKKYIDLIKERNKIGKPLGLSMRYRKYYENDKVIHADVFEGSGTPYPKCKKCETIKIGVINMANEKDEKEQKDKEILEESHKKIEELEEALNSKTKCLEEFKVKIESLEEQISEKDEADKDQESSTKKLEDKILELGMEIEYLGTKKPIVDKILEIRKLDPEELSFYKGKDMEYLQKKLEQFEKESAKIQIQTQEESSEKAMSSEKKEDEKFEVDGKVLNREEAFAHFTKELNLESKKGDK